MVHVRPHVQEGGTALKQRKPDCLIAAVSAEIWIKDAPASATLVHPWSRFTPVFPRYLYATVMLTIAPRGTITILESDTPWKRRPKTNSDKSGDIRDIGVLWCSRVVGAMMAWLSSCPAKSRALLLPQLTVVVEDAWLYTLNSHNAEICLHKPWRPKYFF